MGKILTFWSPAVSAGVTTSALMTAISLSKEYSVCLLDLDLNNSDISLYLNIIDAEHNLDNLMPYIEGRNFSEDVLKMNLVEYDKFSILQGTKKIDKGPHFDMGNIEKIIEMAKGMFDFVILNTLSAIDNPGTYLALKMADKTIMVVEQNALHFKRYIDKAEVIGRLVSNPIVLVNKYDKYILLTEESVKEYFGCEPIKLPNLGNEAVINQINESKDFKAIFLTKKSEPALDALSDRILVEVGLKEVSDQIKKKSLFKK